MNRPTIDAAASNPPLAGRGVPPCNPDTLTACVELDCLQPMHTGGRRGEPRVPCVEGHAHHGAHGRCRRCSDRHRLAQNREARRRSARSFPAAPVAVAGSAWRDQAACDGAPPELFFPELKRGQNVRGQLGQVIAVYCARCPVAKECDSYAELVRAEGLWAGVWRRYLGNTYMRTRIDAARRRAS